MPIVWWILNLFRTTITLIFSRTAGGDAAAFVQGGSFTRPDVATCATAFGIDGTAQLYAADVPRIEYVNGVPGLLLEQSRTNAALGSSSLSDGTYWAGNAGFTLSAATRSCIAGQTAYVHVTTTAGGSRRQSVGTFVNAQIDCFYAIIENSVTNPAVTSQIVIYDVTAVAPLCSASYTWSTGAVAVTVGTGIAGARDLGNGCVLLWINAAGTAAGTGAAGNVRAGYFYPSGLTDNNKTTTVHHLQFEATARAPSSPITTVAAAVTRAADALFYPLAQTSQALQATGVTLYDKYVSRRGFDTNAALVLGTQVGALNLIGMWHQASATQMAGYVSSAAAARPTTLFLSSDLIDTVVERLFVVFPDGSARLTVAVDGTLAVVSTLGAAGDWPTNFGAQKIFLTEPVNAPRKGDVVRQTVKIAVGQQTLAGMRTA